MSADSEPSAQPKYSRYRSIRQAAVSKSPLPSNTARPPEQQNEAIQRSRSRYHRPRVVSPPSNDVPSMPTIPQHLPTLQSLQGGNGGFAQSSSRELRSTRTVTVSKENLQHAADSMGSPTGHPRDRRAEPKTYGTQGLPLKSPGEPGKGAKGQSSEDDEIARLLAEQKRKDLQRLEMELAAAAARTSSSPERSPATNKGVEKLGLFSRRRADSKAAPSKSSSSLNTSEQIPEHKSSEAPKVNADEQPRNILQGGGGAVPGVDAPISAVNAGERRVLIRCKQSSINLPVTPDTTPVELLRSAANILSVPITPSASILLESYTKLGLERRIRRYEHIRDIMNSWDRDTQNALIIQASDSPSHDFDIEVASVPREQPNDVTVYMYHSQKPGKWNKRYITLDSTGQIFISKKKDAKVTDKDIVTLCHLTDFDIYTPTSEEMRINLRPPKKFCYAVKSQQKTTMFLDTAKFVHFFSTDNYDLANTWYDACQQWRSWYLVNIKGEGQKRLNARTKTVKVPGVRTKSGNAIIPSHKVKVSVDEDPYTIGSFKPLMDLDRFGSTDPEPSNEADDERPRQVPFHLRNSTAPAEPLTRRDRHPPAVSYRLPPSADNDSPTFASTGLLGRTYSQRQRAQKEREIANDASLGPFIPGPSLLNTPDPTIARPKTSAIPNDPTINLFLFPPPALPPPTPLSQGGLHKRTPSSATRRPQTSAGLPQRSSTHRRTETKPLIDLTPKFVEAPQWSKEGKGHGVVAPSGVPLVEVAGGRSQGMQQDGVGVMFRRDG